MLTYESNQFDLVGTKNINDELLTHLVIHKERIFAVSEEWKRNNITFVSDMFGYPIKLEETKKYKQFKGILTGLQTLELIQQLVDLGSKSFRDDVAYYYSQSKEQDKILKILESWEIGRDTDMSHETALVLKVFE